jgi:hypothetical protein
MILRIVRPRVIGTELEAGYRALGRSSVLPFLQNRLSTLRDPSHASL